VPVTVTTVAAAPGEPPTGGEPVVVLRVTAGEGVKMADADPESPVAPVTVTVYGCAAAVSKTMKLVPVKAVLSVPFE
jgi:hypothetical protein